MPRVQPVGNQRSHDLSHEVIANYGQRTQREKITCMSRGLSPGHRATLRTVPECAWRGVTTEEELEGRGGSGRGELLPGGAV